MKKPDSYRDDYDKVMAPGEYSVLIREDYLKEEEETSS